MSETMSLAETARALRAGTVTSLDLVGVALEGAARIGRRLGTYAALRDDEALAEAERADAERASGLDRGPLHGVPIGVRDFPGALDDVAVGRLRAAGAVPLGTTTAMEFTIGLPDPGRETPVPRNPWDPAAWAGGASSGTANGIAAGLFPGGVGADAAGGIRMPAAFCGVTGLRPTRGRVPNPASGAVEHLGPMGRTSEDCALLLTAMAGYHPADARCADRPVPEYAAALSGHVEGVRIGVDPLLRLGADLADRSLPLRFGSALDVLAAAGAVIVDVELPFARELYAADMLTLAAEALAHFAPDLTSRWEEFGTTGRTAFATGAFYTAADYVRAQAVRRTGQQAVNALLERVDLVVTPTATVTAPRVDRLDSPGFMAVFGSAVHTPYWSAVGNPTLSVPIGFGDDGLPLAMQISGRPFDEALVLRAGDAYQRRAEWHHQVPDMRGKLARIPAPV
ncbi:amidase [Yinghuangia seranimata]|uniref:amidase n=1 Tax=Yinghuangia seranimata TaxID=408067 RepID=UPI00248B0576|nr:amidase [Yinghuangia seranimata]MDI2130235.1 amidase [Yinghuangia seranimata]